MKQWGKTIKNELRAKLLHAEECFLINSRVAWLIKKSFRHLWKLSAHYRGHKSPPRDKRVQSP